MTFHPADPISLSLFLVFSLAMAILMICALRLVPSWKGWFGAYLGLILLFSIAAVSGIVDRHFLPFGPLLFLSLLVFGTVLAFSEFGKKLAGRLSLSVLIGFQGFRLLLELILHHWASLGTVPETMTWTGQNMDIISGLLSLAAIPFVNKKRNFAAVVNLIGFLLLLNVIRVVVMSSPLPFAWQLENPILLIAKFPYCLIGPLFVLPAWVGHLITFRKLKIENP